MAAWGPSRRSVRWPLGGNVSYRPRTASRLRRFEPGRVHGLSCGRIPSGVVALIRSRSIPPACNKGTRAVSPASMTRCTHARKQSAIAAVATNSRPPQVMIAPGWLTGAGRSDGGVASGPADETARGRKANTSPRLAPSVRTVGRVGPVKRCAATMTTLVQQDCRCAVSG